MRSRGRLCPWEHGLLTAQATDRPPRTTFRQAPVFDSVSSVALQSALDGLSLRQRTIAHNIANVNTPGYHARRVSFEDALARSVGAGSAEMTAATTGTSLEPTNLEGNNVNLETETLSNVDTVLRYQFATQAVGGEANSLRTALRTN